MMTNPRCRAGSSIPSFNHHQRYQRSTIKHIKHISSISGSVTYKNLPISSTVHIGYSPQGYNLFRGSLNREAPPSTTTMPKHESSCPEGLAFFCMSTIEHHLESQRSSGESGQQAKPRLIDFLDTPTVTKGGQSGSGSDFDLNQES